VLIYAALLAMLSGCESSDLPLATVHGTVTYQGQPLDHGMVVFIPEKGTPGPQVVGKIQSDGTFRIQTLQWDGAAVGWHTVLVHCRGLAKQEGQAPTGVPPTQFTVTQLPKQYSVQAESPLRFEVKEGRNEYAIVLQ
jgi:hypothetical protein